MNAFGAPLVAVLWTVILIPIVRGFVGFVRTTRPADLVPRIIRVTMNRRERCSQPGCRPSGSLLP